MTDPNPPEHDDMLFNMLKECKTLPVFLDHIFGFLQRRTDFYHVNKDPNSPIGLPEGLAESIVKQTYFKWMPKDFKDSAPILQECEVPQAVIEEEVVTHEDLCEDTVENVAKITIDENKAIVGFTQSEFYNGGAYENYCWTQTIGELDITVKVPEGSSSKDLKVLIQTSKISVKVKNTTLLEGELHQKCKHNEAIWSLDKQKLQIHLDKCKEIWWDRLVTSEEKLDLSKIDCSRAFEDLPEEAQSKIEELGWNQERKRLGLPTSDELAKEEMLRKAWNAEGSPFSGPFDPSQVVFH